MDNFEDNELTEDLNEKDSVTGESMAELMDLYEESFKRFAEGEVVNGKIISVDKDHVLVDIQAHRRCVDFLHRAYEFPHRASLRVVELLLNWDSEPDRGHRSPPGGTARLGHQARVRFNRGRIVKP